MLILYMSFFTDKHFKGVLPGDCEVINEIRFVVHLDQDFEW